MFRQFRFESEMYEALSCVPLAVRRKLDLVALKISLAGWQALSRPERLALCHLPVDTAEDLATYGEVLEGFAERAGTALKRLPTVTPANWAPWVIPERVIHCAAALGRTLELQAWGALDEETRYCLWKYASTKDDLAKVADLFAEALDPA